MTALTPEQLAEIKDRAEHASGYTIVAHISILEALISEDIPALLTEIQRLQEQVEIVRRVGAEETRKAAYEAMDVERRSWESRRAVDNVTLAGLRAEVERLRAELASAVDALTKPGRDAYAVAGSLEDGINTDHIHATAERDGLAAEVERLRNLHSSAWVDVHNLLAERRDSAMTDNELTEAVMALISRTDDQPGGSK